MEPKDLETYLVDDGWRDSDVFMLRGARFFVLSKEGTVISYLPLTCIDNIFALNVSSMADTIDCFLESGGGPLITIKRDPETKLWRGVHV